MLLLQRKRALCSKLPEEEKDVGNPNDCAFMAETSGNTVRGNKCSAAVVSQMMAAGMDEVWLTNSGASRHITFRRDWLTFLSPGERQ
ncbi:retrovirus-related pol polyprotein from transposon tnt [Lasius niger]|uniref:Retrovirus-related pol polyprotein from transposon tnt n=1 Tax=Lasius niger TaxID=67767 RepID=A0A0J7K4H4_LASNI|nr:retrovirus-related pol polyprotein from transposon tnt [Lasius niger]